MKVINFFLTTLTDDDFYFEGCDEKFTLEDMTLIFEEIRSCEHFIEGDKTEGTITFIDEDTMSIVWTVKNMGEDWDSDESEEHHIYLPQNLIEI